MPAVLAFRWPRCVAAVLVCCAVLVAAQVAVSGSIAWMGLVVPHLARLLVGADHRRLLPTAFWLGAALMLVVDDLARTLTQAEIPIGIITALLGRRCLPCCWCNPDAGVRPDEQLIIAAIATLWPPSAALRPAHAGLPAR
ncbi:putative ABC transport system permease component [Klebsiella pneumoniae]|nr:putative ABC transport system permease component [Klebsiella pneumoniae]